MSIAGYKGGRIDKRRAKKHEVEVLTGQMTIEECIKRKEENGCKRKADKAERGV